MSTLIRKVGCVLLTAAMFITLSSTFSACGSSKTTTADSVQTEQVNLFEAIKKIASENPDGFTVKIPEMEFVTSGYAVAYLETQNGFGDDGIRKALNHAAKHEQIVGGWLNTDDKRYYFDSNRVFQDKDEAAQFAKQQKQITFFDLNTMTEIRVK